MLLRGSSTFYKRPMKLTISKKSILLPHSELPTLSKETPLEPSRKNMYVYKFCTGRWSPWRIDCKLIVIPFIRQKCSGSLKYQSGSGHRYYNNYRQCCGSGSGRIRNFWPDPGPIRNRNKRSWIHDNLVRIRIRGSIRILQIYCAPYSWPSHRAEGREPFYVWRWGWVKILVQKKFLASFFWPGSESWVRIRIRN